MSSPFRKMRGITDRKLDAALTDHRDTLGWLVRSAIAQNRWNVGMVLMLLVAYCWLGALTFAPQYVGYVPAAGAALWAGIWALRRVNAVRARQAREAQQDQQGS